MRPKSRSLRTDLLLTGALAAIVRVGYWAVFTSDRVLTSDAAQYEHLARNLSEGRGYVDTYPWLELHATAFRPPGYPGLLGFVYWLLWPSHGLARGLNVALGISVVAATVVVVNRHLGRTSALAAGVTVACYPNFVANDTYVLSEPLSLLLLVLTIGWVADRRWLPAAVPTGLLVLTKPSAQYLVVVLATCLLVSLGWRRAVGFSAVAALVVAPWIVRNWMQLGSPVLVTSNGFNYAAMYSPPADANGGFVDPLHHPWFDDRRLDQSDEVVWDRELRRTAVDHVLDRPGLIPEVIGRNALATFEVTPSVNERPDLLDGRSAEVRRATFWVLWPLVGLGVLGAVRHRRDPLVVAAAVVGSYFTLASLVFVAPPRLRSPMELCLIVCASALLGGREVRRWVGPVGRGTMASDDDGGHT